METWYEHFWFFLCLTRSIWKPDGGTKIMNNRSKSSDHAVENGPYRSETEFLFLNTGPWLSRKSDYKTAVPTTDKEHIYRSLVRTIPSLPRQQFELWNVFSAAKSVWKTKTLSNPPADVWPGFVIRLSTGPAARYRMTWTGDDAQHLCFQKPQDSNNEVEVRVERLVQHKWLQPKRLGLRLVLNWLQQPSNRVISKTQPTQHCVH